MLKILILAALTACIMAESKDGQAEIEFLKSDIRRNGFDHEFATTNHIHQHAQGDELGNINGEFEWLSPEGKPFVLKYIADERGYRPVSDWLPTPPPIPEGILKGLEYIKTHTKSDGYHYRL